jgi:hypothetical protein
MSEKLFLETAPPFATSADGAANKPDDDAAPISRQLKWRRLRKKLGLCVQCSRPSPEKTVLCPECSIKHRIKRRKQMGYHSREETGRGRKWKYP